MTSNFNAVGMHFKFNDFYSDEIIANISEEMGANSKYQVSDVDIEYWSSFESQGVYIIHVFIVLGKSFHCSQQGKIINSLRREFNKITQGYRTNKTPYAYRKPTHLDMLFSKGNVPSKIKFPYRVYDYVNEVVAGDIL